MVEARDAKPRLWILECGYIQPKKHYSVQGVLINEYHYSILVPKVHVSMQMLDENVAGRP